MQSYPFHFSIIKKGFSININHIIRLCFNLLVGGLWGIRI